MRIAWSAAAAASLAAAAVALLLAVDVGRWDGAFARDDIRFRATPLRRDLWWPTELLPGHAAGWLLKVDDDVEYRRALQTFWRGRPNASPFALGIAAKRSVALAGLAEYVRLPREPHRRAQAANLLGVTGLGLAMTDDPRQRLRFVTYAADAFRGALAVDPTNEDAKYNLELALRLLRNQPNDGVSGTSRGVGRAGGAARARPGSGY